MARIGYFGKWIAGPKWWRQQGTKEYGRDNIAKAVISLGKQSRMWC